MMYTLLQRKKEEEDISNAGSLILLKGEKFLAPLLAVLDAYIDKRLVRTFYDVCLSILRFRNRSFGLVLSELGGYVMGFRQAAAGTKRISNLLRSRKWDHHMIEDFWLREAARRYSSLRRSAQRILFLWDDSVLEKPESWFVEGLCSVASSKAKRLTRVKPGYYTPPRQRLCVPGFEWSAVMMTTLKAVPSLVTMRFWTTRGKHFTDRKSVFIHLLKRLVQCFPQGVTHVLDRGYADSSLLLRLQQYRQAFIVRWIKKYHLLGLDGVLKNAAEHTRSALGTASIRLIYDAPRRCLRRATLTFLPLCLPQDPQHVLYLLACQDGKRRQQPMYLLTNQIIQTKAQAWQVLFSYMRRWNIEQTFRFAKSELAMESPRLWFWENRLKLWAIVACVYAFLLHLLTNWNALARTWINTCCHRTGKRHLDTQMPLYRLRLAILVLLNEVVAQNSG